jgi:hypothetical protein
VIAWTTDEPSTTIVHFGTSPALGTTVSVPDEFTPDHVLALTGLAPSTQYFYEVESTDPDGNGPTLSAVESFTTAAVPDTEAPLIVSGPEVINATDTSLTVVWTTNEASTSGVSYNDGTTFHVVDDDALVTTHAMVLAGLTPDTLYQITVSSTDLNGNGPTLGGPVTGRTLATADTDPPVISNVNVTDITETSAVVSWLTDEPATSQVRFGTVSGAPSGLSGDSALVTEHHVLLNGLQTGVTYYFTVVSQDGSENSAESAEGSFATATTDADGDGVGDARDRCAGTPQGEIVNADGCSISQLCPCAGPRGSHEPWKNHGKYVSCVTQAAQDFRRDRLITASQREAIVRQAAQSECGRDSCR